MIGFSGFGMGWHVFGFLLLLALVVSHGVLGVSAGMP
jgi:hypothetical protein